MWAYALSSGMPTIFITHFGPHIQAKWPAASSLADFAQLRFGARARGVVLCISMLNMCVGLLAELTTIGALFRDFVGGGALPMILISSTLATLYTAYGGLKVSFVTDQLQALFSIVLIICLTAYTSAVFATGDTTLPTDLGPLRAQLGPYNPYGISSLSVMPSCLLASTKSYKLLTFGVNFKFASYTRC
jgi:Na+/proline symporter